MDYIALVELELCKIRAVLAGNTCYWGCLVILHVMYLPVICFIISWPGIEFLVSQTETIIHDQVLPGHIARIIGQQKYQGPHDILCLEHALSPTMTVVLP